VKLLKQIKGRIKFQPSAIAIHPFTGNIYLLSNIGRILVVYSGDGELLDVVYLSKDIFSQPEGMCFDKEGDLYISNEANGLGARILCFDFM